MGAIASQITSLTIVYSTVYSDAYQRKHQSSGVSRLLYFPQLFQLILKQMLVNLDVTISTLDWTADSMLANQYGHKSVSETLEYDDD